MIDYINFLVSGILSGLALGAVVRLILVALF